MQVSADDGAELRARAGRREEAGVEALLQLRARLREKAAARESLSAGELWGICDEYRDKVLPESLGVDVKVTTHPILLPPPTVTHPES